MKRFTSCSSMAAGDATIPTYKRTPGWVVEGIPDYIRWFLYEPQSHGADAILLPQTHQQTPQHQAELRRDVPCHREFPELCGGAS
jgi:hypothetical protein